MQIVKGQPWYTKTTIVNEKHKLLPFGHTSDVNLPSDTALQTFTSISSDSTPRPGSVLGLEPVKLAIHDLEADEGRRHVFGNDDRERDAFATRLEEWVEAIRGGDLRPVSDRSICPDCDFRGFCRYAPAEARPVGQ
jgi:hypothetical protein